MNVASGKEANAIAKVGVAFTILKKSDNIGYIEPNPEITLWMWGDKEGIKEEFAKQIDKLFEQANSE